MKFEEAVEVILFEEGGDKITRDPHDPGGLTKYGISQGAYPDLDIANLTKEEAVEIYRRDYWDALHLDVMPSAIRLIVFDCGVNQGRGAASGLLQTVLGVPVDGVIGNQTLTAVKKVILLDRLIEVYSKARHLRYLMNPKFPRYGGGWTKRLLNITIKSMQELIRKPS